MKVTVNEFLGASYRHGYITILNNKVLNEVLWEGVFETADNHIPWNIHKLEVIKWGIENNGIVIYVNYENNKGDE